MILRVLGIIAVLTCAAPAAAAGGALELGPAFTGRSFSGQLGLTGRFSLPVGALEVTARGYFFSPAQPVLGATLAVRYRTPLLSSLLSFAGGLGATVWFECLGSDFCLGLGPFVEVSPTLEFPVSDGVRIFAALNGDLGFLPFFARPKLWVAGSLSVGLMFDFVPSRVETAPAN